MIYTYSEDWRNWDHPIPVIIYNDEPDSAKDWFYSKIAGGFMVNFGKKNRGKKLNEVDSSWLDWAWREIVLKGS